jgi:hypothetical protein
MKLDAVYALGVFAGALPSLAIVVILAHFFLLRIRWRLNRRLGRRLGYYPSTIALGMALQFLNVFWRPSVAHVVETRQEADADEDDNGDPDTPAKQFDRQLKRIRRGEPVDRLVLRL